MATKKIYKYPISHGKTKLPEGAHVLSVGMQQGQLMVWAIVDVSKPLPFINTFAGFHTGETLPPEPGKYVGTFLMEEQTDVLHIFQLSTGK